MCHVLLQLSVSLKPSFPNFQPCSFYTRSAKQLWANCYKFLGFLFKFFQKLWFVETIKKGSSLINIMFRKLVWEKLNLLDIIFRFQNFNFSFWGVVSKCHFIINKVTINKKLKFQVNISKWSECPDPVLCICSESVECLASDFLPHLAQERNISKTSKMQKHFPSHL